MSASEWAVGQEVILRDRLHRGSRDSTATISRVARKYVYITTYGRERAFEIETGRERTGPKDSGFYAGQIYTAESLAEHDRRRAALSRLGEATRGYSWADRLSTEAVEAILTILDGETQ